VVLLILDGCGYREQTPANVIAPARTSAWDALWERCLTTPIRTSGASVGLPSGQMGHSEVRHLNIGAGQTPITADRGNAEQMCDPVNARPHTAHTANPEPLLYLGPHRVRLMEGGALCDIAPSHVATTGLPQLGAMRGQSLVRFTAEAT
jgi:bisphosphoglycerate-independent phosphoglycerate mutase (AlkP superfamily)